MLETQLADLVRAQLPGPEFYVVDVQLQGHRLRPKVVVLIDGDRGVTVDDCAAVSRALNERIEAEELMTDGYVLEVSSPGVDHPLTEPRHFPRHVGRKVAVTLRDGAQVEGTLRECTDEALRLEVKPKGRGRKSDGEARTLLFEDVEYAKVIVAF
ncbi:MAG: ribosome maturation factor RimP [Catalinimonas sp.]